jgi:hypothetical protein
MCDYVEEVENLKMAALKLRSVTVSNKKNTVDVDLSGAFLYAIGFVEGVTDGMLASANTPEDVQEAGRSAERLVFLVISEGAKALKTTITDPEGYA